MDLPAHVVQHIQTLKVESRAHFPEQKDISIFAGQVDQETCYSITHPKCWNPRTELKTSREYGFGLGQITIAYNAQGKELFNNFIGARQLHPSLRDWKWEDRYDPVRQLRVLVLMNRSCYNSMKFASDWQQQNAFMLSCYNGGARGVMMDREICKSTKGCDPNQWFDNVEKYSLKSKTKVAGYGQSFYDINRSYVRNILFTRKKKYELEMQK